MANTVYDSDQDQENLSSIRSAEHDVEQSRYNREFNDITDNYEGSVKHPLGDKESNTASVSLLKNKEETIPDRSSLSAADNMREKLGLGYTGKGSTKSKGLSKLYSSDSKLKKRIAIAGAAAGGGIIGAILVFFAMLPLKIEHIITNLDSHYSSATEAAVSKESENLLSQYITRNVIDTFNTTKCHTTIDPKCVVVTSGTGPVGQLYAAWSKNRLENQLATKYGIIISKQADRFYMTIDGHNIDISDYRVGHPHAADSIFDVPGTREVSRSEIRQALRDGLRDGTLWDNTYKRYVYARYLERQFGVKFCVVACNLQDKFTASKEAKLRAAKLYLIQRVVTPTSANYSLLMQCILSGPSDGCNPTKLDTAEPGDDAPMSNTQQRMQEQLIKFRDTYGEEKLASLFEKSKAISEKGLSKYIYEAIADKVATSIGAEAGQVATQVGEKAIPVVGWVLLVAKIVGGAQTVGPVIRAIGYLANSNAAVATYSTYSTVASEMKSGHIDVTELGSFSDALSTNMSGSSNDQHDATSTPLYNNLMGGSSTTTTASIFGSAYADTTSSAYTCDNGKPVPSGQLVCTEEKLDRGNDIASQISDVANVPGIKQIGQIGNVISNVVETISDATIGKLTGVCKALAPCNAGMEALGNVTQPAIDWLQKKVISSPINDTMSGGRIFDMMAAGADVANNAACQTQLGCQAISDQQAAILQNQQLVAIKSNFDNQSIFARIFSTTSSYSLVSRLAMDMPTSFLGVTQSGIASVLSNPMGTLGSIFSGIMSSNHAFAASDTTADPFGVVQYGYNDADIPSDPEAFWEQNCTTGPLGTYNQVTHQLDVSAWQNDSNNVVVDQDTGTAKYLHSNPCLLIQASVISTGAMFDSSLIPRDSTGIGSSTTLSTPSTATTIPTGTTKDLAQQILTSPNITFQTRSEWESFQQVATTGMQTGPCSTVPIDSRLLGLILAASQNYKLVLGVFNAGHPCTGFQHQKGKAVDINGINKLDGSTGTGNNIHWTSDEKGIVTEFYSYMANLMSKNGGGEMGQKECFASNFGTSPPATPSGVTIFDDSCDHLHIDTGNS